MARPICEYIDKYGTDSLDVVINSFLHRLDCAADISKEDKTSVTELLNEMSKYLKRGLQDEATRCKGE